jgi:hypothetical protein
MRTESTQKWREFARGNASSERGPEHSPDLGGKSGLADPDHAGALSSRVPIGLLLASVLLDAGWFAVCLVIAERFQSNIAIALAALPVLKWLLLILCRHSGHASAATKTLASLPLAPSRHSELTTPLGARR